MKEDQLKELDRLAHELKEKANEYGTPLFCVYGKDKQGFYCSGLFNGDQETITRNLVTVLICEPNIKQLLRNALNRSAPLLKNETLIAIETPVKPRK